MDRRLFEAAYAGNVEYLQKLIQDDPCLFSLVSLSGTCDTPLHIACLAGHLNFVKEVLKLNQEFARELNQDGFSPLHIASANGNIEIAKELLKVDCNLCLIKGRERRIPLHYASIKGRVDVVKELLSASSDSVADVGARGETALHLAVKNNQFDAFRVLLEHLKEFNKEEDVLNMKDSQGNTILHLAVSSKQYEVIELLLNEHIVPKSLVEVNSLNGSGLTPLDVLLVFQSEAGDREIEDILTRAGAKKARDLHSLSHQESTQNRVFATYNSSNAQSRTEQVRSPSNHLLGYFKYDEINDSPSKVRNTLLVIAILITTATYQAVLSPPGGVWQDDLTSNDNNNSIKPHTAGRSIMGSHNSISYGLFLLFNSIGFFTSLHMINILTLGFPLRLELQVSSVALIVTYDTCMTATAPNSTISFFFTGISIVFPILFPVISMVLRNYLRRLRDSLPRTNQASD